MSLDERVLNLCRVCECVEVNGEPIDLRLSLLKSYGYKFVSVYLSKDCFLKAHSEFLNFQENTVLLPQDLRAEYDKIKYDQCRKLEVNE